MTPGSSSSSSSRFSGSAWQQLDMHPEVQPHTVPGAMCVWPHRHACSHVQTLPTAAALCLSLSADKSIGSAGLSSAGSHWLVHQLWRVRGRSPAALVCRWCITVAAAAVARCSSTGAYCKAGKAGSYHFVLAARR
jgi:hypothetical protein